MNWLSLQHTDIDVWVHVMPMSTEQICKIQSAIAQGMGISGYNLELDHLASRISPQIALLMISL